jgi:hypothetical protein
VLSREYTGADIVSTMRDPDSSRIARNGRSRVLLPRFVLFVSLIGLAVPARGEVSVLSNRTRQEVVVEVSSTGEGSRTINIPSGDSRPVFYHQKASVRFGHVLAPILYDLSHGAAYMFLPEADGRAVRMERIGLGASDTESPKPAAAQNVAVQPVRQEVTISIKIAVDDDEPTHRTVWEPRLRQRIAQASAILEQHCGVKLAVTSIELWDSDDKVREFVRSMREFEREVKPDAAQLVIGFSSQYDFSTGQIHLGGGRGPLYPFIMLKERAPEVREPEKLELLVHEVAHFLGASHSPEPQSVMRPVLTVSRLRATGERIYIDPVNTLLMSLMANEMQRSDIRKFGDVSWATKARMLEIYKTLQQALPGDPAAVIYQSLIGAPSASPMNVEVREILSQLTRFAELEQSRAAQAKQAGQEISGDELMARYVREAAAIAADFRTDDSPKAFLLALGVFIDDGDALRSFPATSDLVNQIEPRPQRDKRVSVLGAPTMRERRDWAKHFFVSAHLAATIGPDGAKSAGLVKETLDAQGDSGFSYTDMAANRAGIIFATKLLDGNFTLDQLARSFTVDKFMPAINDLDEGLTAVEMSTRITGPGAANLSTELDQIEQRILSLPVYQQKHQP